MAQTTLNIKLDENLKAEFAQICKNQERSVSVVLREFIKNYCQKSQYGEPTLMSEKAFYQQIDHALLEKPVDMSRDELFSLLRG